MADSKLLYGRERGMQLLERGVLACLAQCGPAPATWKEAWQLLAPACCEQWGEQPWHAQYDEPLPLCAADLQEASARLSAGLRAAGVRLASLASRVVFPALWNDWNERHPSKGSVLSLLTLDLLAEVLSPLDGETLILCDKHGGRNHYHPLVQERLTESLVQVLREGRAESAYAWANGDARTEMRVCVRGERFLPVALASMTSKYLRELSMRAFNAWWCAQVPDLRPTAGYGEDAPRFRAQVAAAALAAELEDRVWWRWK